jgi:quaternary ammonium compound-resistance protein SugE
MAWIILVAAGLFEVGWAICLKYAKGMTALWPTIGFFVFLPLSLGFLYLALRTLPLGTAYAVWTGIGAVGTAIIGIAFLGESTDLWRLASIGLILAGIVGLKLVST